MLVGGSDLAVFYPDTGYKSSFDGDMFEWYNGEFPSYLDGIIREVATENELGFDWINDAVARHNDSEYETNLTHHEYIMLVENPEEPDWFYNAEGEPVVALYHLSLLGIIASKLLANRDKDIRALSQIIPLYYNNSQEFIQDYETRAKFFTSSPRYETMIKNMYSVMGEEW